MKASVSLEIVQHIRYQTYLWRLAAQLMVISEFTMFKNSISCFSFFFAVNTEVTECLVESSALNSYRDYMDSCYTGSGCWWLTGTPSPSGCTSPPTSGQYTLHENGTPSPRIVERERGACDLYHDGSMEGLAVPFAVAGIAQLQATVGSSYCMAFCICTLYHKSSLISLWESRACTL